MQKIAMWLLPKALDAHFGFLWQLQDMWDCFVLWVRSARRADPGLLRESPVINQEIHRPILAYACMSINLTKPPWRAPVLQCEVRPRSPKSLFPRTFWRSISAMFSSLSQGYKGLNLKLVVSSAPALWAAWGETFEEAIQKVLVVLYLGSQNFFSFMHPWAFMSHFSRNERGPQRHIYLS